MRKYLLPSALILLLGLGYALAQTFVRAVQLSQDTSGAFSIDSNNGFYFPGHVLSQGTPAPTILGNGSNTVTGTDFMGTANFNGVTASVVFGRAYLTLPSCVVTVQNGGAAGYFVTTTGINLTQIAAVLRPVNYFCSSAS
jgi:hypothetical protein